MNLTSILWNPIFLRRISYSLAFLTATCSGRCFRIPLFLIHSRKKLPLGLLTEASEYVKTNKSALLEQEPFQQVFGTKSQRKRVKLDQLMVARTVDSSSKATSKQKSIGTTEGEARATENHVENEDDEDSTVDGDDIEDKDMEK